MRWGRPEAHECVHGALSIRAHPSRPLLALGSGRDSILRVWDPERRAIDRWFLGHESYILSLAFDRSGARLASGSGDDTARLWDFESGAQLHALTGHTGAINAVAWNASGAQVATGSSDHTVRVWRADSGALQHVLEGHASYVFALAAHPEGDLFASGSDDKTLRLWRWSSNECVRTLRGHRASVRAMTATAEWIVSAAIDRSLRVWSWESEACVRVIDGAVVGVHAFSLALRGSTLVTCGLMDKTARAWDVSTHPSLWAFASMPTKMHFHGIEILADGRAVLRAIQCFLVVPLETSLQARARRRRLARAR